MLSDLIPGRRLKDISDLPLDLAIQFLSLFLQPLRPAWINGFMQPRNFSERVVHQLFSAHKHLVSESSPDLHPRQGQQLLSHPDQKVAELALNPEPSQSGAPVRVQVPFRL